MAVPCHIAFGHYLRTLRERRGLSLDEVWSLSQAFPEPLNKGYLSRCENGKQKLALPKVVALSRIYEIPADALLERLELDLELERLGGPDTEGMDTSEMRLACQGAAAEGARWNSYAFARDATLRLGADFLDESNYQSIEEQRASLFVNVASMAQALGMYRYSIHECLYVERTGALGPNLIPLLSQRLATGYARMGKFDLAEQHIQMGLQRLEDSDKRFAPYLYQTRASLFVRQGDPKRALPWMTKAYDSYRERGLTKESVVVLQNLADCYRDLKNYRAALRTVEAMRSVSEQFGLIRHKAFSLLMCGLIEVDIGREQQAGDHFRQAAEIAKNLNDKILRFQIDFYRYKHALRNDRSAVSRSIRRRLQKLAVSVPETTKQLIEFRAMESA